MGKSNRCSELGGDVCVALESREDLIFELQEKIVSLTEDMNRINGERLLLRENLKDAEDEIEVLRSKIQEVCE